MPVKPVKLPSYQGGITKTPPADKTTGSKTKNKGVFTKKTELIAAGVGAAGLAATFLLRGKKGAKSQPSTPTPTPPIKSKTTSVVSVTEKEKSDMSSDVVKSEVKGSKKTLLYVGVGLAVVIIAVILIKRK